VTPHELPPEAYAAALAELPGIGPARLVTVLQEDPPELVWNRVLAGDIRRPDPAPSRPYGQSRATWAGLAARCDVGGQWSAIQAAGIRVFYLGGPGFPPRLLTDPEPPGVLFWRGDVRVLDRTCVAIIGTRHCTSYGRSVAAELGRDLAGSDVCVVSGLALGIDGAAHQGALAASGGAGPLGVAASGVDTPYPRRHAELWRRVAVAGAIISEAAPRQPAQAWRFPARNRIIAALSRVVVVVESHAGGGSMLTVSAAADRGIDVLAVPGPVTSASSIGTNQLLHEGAAPVRHAGDVLAALGDLRPWPPKPTKPPPQSVRPSTPHPTSSRPSARTREDGRALPPTLDPALDSTAGPIRASGQARAVRLDGPERRVLNSIGRTPTSTSVIADLTGLPIRALSVVLLHLEAQGLVRGAGTWWERCDEQ
jgi:DNA processing protein